MMSNLTLTVSSPSCSVDSKWSIDECIETYTDMFGSIFGKKGLPVDWRGRVKGRFDSIVLEECIQDILKKRGLSIDEPLENPQHARCRV